MNQTDFSEIINCSASTVHAIESGRLKLSPGLAEKIFTATGVCPEWLMANNRGKPMIEGLTKRPYRKAAFEAIQERKHLPSIATAYYYRLALLCRLGEFCSVLSAAQNISAEAALAVMYRMEQLSKTLVAEFGADRKLYEPGSGPDRALDVLAKTVEPWATLTRKPIKLTKEQMDAHAAKYGPLTCLVKDEDGNITGTAPMPLRPGKKSQAEEETPRGN